MIKTVIKLINNDEILRTSTYLIKKILQLEHHNVIKVFNMYKDQSDGQYYAEYEFCNLYSLNELIEQNKIELPLLNLLITQILEGLSYLHNQGLVHSDLKLSNVLLKKEGMELTFKIGDLFTLKNDPSPFTINGGFFKPEIISPEVYKLKVITAKADIWSFGVMLYILFTGQYPFGDRRKITIKEIKRNVKKNLIIGPPLKQIISPYNDFIALCLDPDPKKRPSAKDFLKMIN